MKSQKLGVRVAEEFDNLSGDPRLRRRAMQLVEAWQCKPGLGFPQIFNDAQLEAAYRFFSNVGLGFAQLLEPHMDATAARCELYREILAVHDTTTFVFGGDRDGLGFINKNNRGFLSHITLAVAAQREAMPLGVVAGRCWVRTQSRASKGVPQRKLRHSDDCESHRWLQAVEEVESRLAGGACAVHVMDREGDIYDCVAAMTERGYRFVIRASANRGIVSDDPDERLVFDTLEGLPVRFRDEVSVSQRKAARMPDQREANPAREGRSAKISITATEVTLKRSSHCPPGVAKTTKTNLVHVFESNPPKDEKPVEWVLMSNEPIETDAQLRQIIDTYRKRWLIEEYFKAIKTGCAFSKRQLGSYQALQNALALCLPVAWALLLARAQSRANEQIPAAGLIPQLRINVLRAKLPKMVPDKPTLRHIAYAIARIGGHLKRNGPPGWLTLQRGFEELLILEQGWIMSTQTCDQS